MKQLFSILLICLALSAKAQTETKLPPKLENIAWIAGTWQGEAFGGQIEEIWSQPSGGSMMATFKLVAEGKVQFYEIEVIREVENSLILQLKHFNNDLKGWETKDETIDFPLKYITETKVVFEGMTFEKVSEHEMTVNVDMKDENGKVSVMPFHYKKVISHPKPIKQLTEVPYSEVPITIDGQANEKTWINASWHPIDQRWLGEPFSDEDFKGRYKLTWREDALYLLAEITDDILRDVYKNPLERWWDEDCLEVFLDEDNSGGGHQYNYNAFAYHIDLEGNVVDVTPSTEGKLYNAHAVSSRITQSNITVWEVKLLLFDDSYTDDNINTPVELSVGKNIGFALAYCDNDNSDHRENFIGSIYVEGNDKDRGWIDANIFGTLVLKK